MFRRSFLMRASALTVFCVASTARAEPPVKEQTRIEKLIAFVENQKNMKFIRNGTEYSCADAAKFLRGKMDSMGGEVTSARDFIERIASKSSMSGQPYQVKFADGKTMLAAQFLSEELKRLEGQPT
jgi:Family of unknown function (DUF5329)